MATYMDIGKVKVLCSCEKPHPLCRLYFCRHCLEVRCHGCVSHEVDSHYCPNCLENMPSAEAKMRKNRCPNCFDCPSCGHTLSTRATVALIPRADDPTQTSQQKAYYLACGYCRWTTRDAGIKDQKAVSGGWPDLENTNLQRISTLVESFRQLAVREKLEKERKKYARKRNYFSFSDKFGLYSSAMRRRSSAASRGISGQAEAELAPVNIPAAEASEEVEELDEEMYLSQPLVIEKVTTIGQRLMCPDSQPTLTEDLAPRHKQFLVKRSMRCRCCEHNLSKSEFNPASIKFKINLGALYHVPELRIREIPADLKFGQKSKMVLTLFNPAHRVTTIKLSPVTGEADTYSTAKLLMPEGEVKMAPRDDAAEYDESGDTTQDFQDDPKIIAFRRANKAGVHVSITPMKSVGPVRVALEMTFDYKNTTAALQPGSKSDPEVVSITLRICLDLGLLETKA